MQPWVLVTLFAAFAQNLRFMLQRHLKVTTLSTGGATFARFVYSAPLIAGLALGYAWLSEQALPGLSGRFWVFALTGGTAQIAATMCVVALFARRNFAVGITFKKTEVLQAALVGIVVLGEGVSFLGLAAILIGFGGVLVLSDAPVGQVGWRARLTSPASALGLASGLLFAISGVTYRGATLSLETGDAFLRALVTLALVTAFQTIAMALWLAWRERGELGRVMAAWRVAGLVGLTSMAGSIGWFTAFALQNVAYVKALGQVELVFSLIGSVVVFKERITGRELAGVALISASVLALVLAI